MVREGIRGEDDVACRRIGADGEAAGVLGRLREGEAHHGGGVEGDAIERLFVVVVEGCVGEEVRGEVRGDGGAAQDEACVGGEEEGALGGGGGCRGDQPGEGVGVGDGDGVGDDDVADDGHGGWMM